MTTHKNNNEPIGNYCIYAIFIDIKTFKIGKADLDRTDKDGIPLRIKTQIKLFRTIFSMSFVNYEIVFI